LNFVPGQVLTKMTITPIGSDGTVSFYNSSARAVQLVGDVLGYLASAPTAEPGVFKALAPVRLLDTRTGNGAPKAAVRARGTVTLQVVGRGGVPAGVTAVVINETVTSPGAAGYLTSYASGAARPNSSSLNFTRGQTVPNLVVVPVGADGRIRLYNGSGANLSLIVDVAGVFVGRPPLATGAFGPVPISRLLDTRTGNGAARRELGAGQSLILRVSGRGGVPAAAATRAVVLNVTATTISGPGYLTIWGSGARPSGSDLNLSRGATITNLVVTPVTADGSVHVYNGSGTAVSVIADVEGYIRR